MNPLISIIIPCYNYGRYVGEAIESALNQTYRPVEVLLINDGSTDETLDIAAKYPIHVYSQENKGAGNAFNTGIKLSNGVYIVKLDADDRLDPFFVEKTYSLLSQRQREAFVYVHAYLFGTRTGKLLGKPYNIDTLKEGNYITSALLIKKSAFFEGGFYDESLPILEDYDLWLSFAEKGIHGVLLPEPLYYYRQQKQSRGVYSKWRFRRTMMKIWRKHRHLYSVADIIRIMILLRVTVFASAILERAENLAHNRIKAKITTLKMKFKERVGCIIVDQ